MYKLIHNNSCSKSRRCKSILDSSGNLNKGLLIGDYKIKKTQRNQPMRRDSFIKVPKKASNSKGAL